MHFPWFPGWDNQARAQMRAPAKVRFHVSLEMNRESARTRARARKLDANFEVHLRRVIEAARTEAHKRRLLRFAAQCGNRVSRQHEGLRGEEHQRGIAVMMRKRILPFVIVIRANILRTAAIFHITRERIGKMNMMMRMFEPIHDADIGLRR